MTKKNATRKSKRSLVHATAAIRSRPHPRRRAPKKKSSRVPSYPFERKHAAMQNDDSHPIDEVVDRIPKIRSLDRTLLRQSVHWQTQVPNAADFRDYEDLRLQQRLLREEAFFDAGHETGRLAGLSEAAARRAAASPEGDEFARRITMAAFQSNLPADELVAVVLESVREILSVRIVKRASPRISR